MRLKRNLDRMLRQIRDASFTVQYWDGEQISYGDGDPEFTIRLTDPQAVNRMLRNVLVHLPEAYVAGQLEFDGDLQHLLRLCYRVDQRLLRVNPLRKALLYLNPIIQRNSLSGARTNVSYHYDLGNDFFKAWLDNDMNYSCAYFEHADDDLETAQRQKLRHLCTKLRLEPGQRLLDIGSGWGALAMHAAKEYGVRVLGIILSEEQRSLCQPKIRQRGLEDRVEVRLQDYRQLENETFDRVVSVGMIEHVGQSYLRSYMETVAQCLRPKGIGVFQTMGQTQHRQVTPWITKYIFPGMYLPTIAELSSEMARAGLRVSDIENLRPHYALTLDAWIERFEKMADTFKCMFDERFVRMWRMYLHSASAAFKHGELNLWQITFTNGFNDELPLTRRYMYREPCLEHETLPRKYQL